MRTLCSEIFTPHDHCCLPSCWQFTDTARGCQYFPVVSAYATMNPLLAEDPQTLLEHAASLLSASYAPYSYFNVACLLLARRRLPHASSPNKSDGNDAEQDELKLFEGVNVENGSYSLTMCAECVAVGKAISAGYGEILKVFVLGRRHHSGRPATLVDKDEVEQQECWPCGACRQVLAEFAVPECEVMTASGKGKLVKAKLADLLPRTFRFSPSLS